MIQSDDDVWQGNLKRTPTPYPKEMKHRLQHMRNLAYKQLNVPNGAAPPGQPSAQVSVSRVLPYSSLHR